MSWLNDFLRRPISIVYLNLIVLALYLLITQRRLFILSLKNLKRNLKRSIFTGLATVVLVFIVTLIWTVLWFLDRVTEKKSGNFRAIVTERWQIPSQMPFSYARTLEEGAVKEKGDIKPEDAMTWQFYGGTIDKNTPSRANALFFFAMDPEKLLTVMPGHEDWNEADRKMVRQAIDKVKENPRYVIIGRDRLKAMNKQVGESIKITSLNYKGIDLECDIVATFPDGRFNNSALMQRRYLNNAMEDYNRNNPIPHPLTNKSLNLVWLKVKDTPSFNKISKQIETSSNYTVPAVKVETESSGIASFLDAYRDLLWGMRWVLVPVILATMCLVIANAISISVRERTTEMAVLKVLGFTPLRVMFLVLLEAVIIGAFAGFFSAFATWYLVNYSGGGIKFPIAFFPVFRIPDAALIWGPMIGAGTAFVGSFLPAWSARKVKVSEVFSRVS